MTVIHLPIAALCLLGFVISTYAYSVEQRADEARRMGKDYRAACDVGPFSCTRVFSSEFGYVTQFFGLPKVSNAALGIAFYLLELLCCWSPTLLLCMSAQGVVASLGLGYLLLFILHDVCVVCCSIYVVNTLIAVLAYRWWRRQSRVCGDGKGKAKASRGKRE